MENLVKEKTDERKKSEKNNQAVREVSLVDEPSAVCSWKGHS